MPAPSEPRFLISRQSAIGDCILTMPLLCALRDHFPRAFIAWAVEPAAGSLLKGHAGLDRIVTLKKGWLKSPTAVWRLRGELRSLAIDTVIDPQSLTKSAVAGWLSGAKRRIGFASPQGRELAPWLSTIRVAKTQEHVVDYQRELLKPLGVTPGSVRFDVPHDPVAEAIADAFLKQSRFANGFIVINPGASWESKRWPEDRYAQVARHVGTTLNLDAVVVWSGERERQWAEQIVASSRGRAIMAPRTSLPELAALLRRAKLFVGSDTGPLHLAAAVGTPCVAMYGPTQPEKCGPYGTGHVTLQAFYQSGTSRQRRTAGNDAMRAIMAESVCQACEEILGRVSARKAA